MPTSARVVVEEGRAREARVQDGGHDRVVEHVLPERLEGADGGHETGGALALLFARAGEQEDGLAGPQGCAPAQASRAEVGAVHVQQGEAGLVVEGDAARLAQPAVAPTTTACDAPSTR